MMEIAGTKARWQRILGVALLVHLTGIVMRWCFPGVVTKSQVWAIIASMFVLKMLADLPGALQRYGRARQAGASVTKSLSSLMPAALVGLFRVDRETQRAFFTWLSRRPPATNAIAGKGFGYYRSSQYPTIFIIVMVSCVTEVPFSHLMIDVIVPDPVLAQYLHWGMLVSVVYSIMLLCGDRHLLRHSQHVLAPQGVHLSVGARFNAEIPWEAVEAVFPVNNIKELKEARSAWLRRLGFDPAESVIGTPVDVPNVVLVLKKSVPVNIEKYRMARRDVRNVLTYVDEPGAFVQAVRERLALQDMEAITTQYKQAL